jgi:hypothetical protein
VCGFEAREARGQVLVGEVRCVRCGARHTLVRGGRRMGQRKTTTRVPRYAPVSQWCEAESVTRGQVRGWSGRSAWPLSTDARNMLEEITACRARSKTAKR